LSCFAAVQEKSGTVLQGRSLSPDWKFSIEVGAWFLRGPGEAMASGNFRMQSNCGKVDAWLHQAKLIRNTKGEAGSLSRLRETIPLGRCSSSFFVRLRAAMAALEETEPPPSCVSCRQDRMKRPRGRDSQIFIPMVFL
jgi:hypothetical protein